MKGMVLDAKECGVMMSVYLYRVRFVHGKYAVIRCVDNTTLKTGCEILREGELWESDSKKIKLLPFEYIEEAESKRKFQEY